MTGLPIEAFEIFEEGNHQTITRFTDEARARRYPAVLLDVSDSTCRTTAGRCAIGRRAVSVRAARQERRVLSRGVQSRASRADALDAGPDVVGTAIATLKPFGSTALYDAVLTRCR